MARRTLEEKIRGLTSPGSPRLFFRILSVFRGLDSFPDWVACDASARYFVVLKIRKNTTKCTKSTKMKFGDLYTCKAFLPLIPSCPSCPSWCYKPKSSGLRVAPEWGLTSSGSPRLFSSCPQMQQEGNLLIAFLLLRHWSIGVTVPISVFTLTSDRTSNFRYRL